jgi:hypothetical protein
MRFGTTWEAPNQVITHVTLHLKNTAQGSTSATLDANRTTWDWGNSMTWNQMMSQPGGTNLEGASATPNVQGLTGTTNAWWTIDLREDLPGRYRRHLARLWGPTHTRDSKKFNSNEATAANRPYMVVSYDTIPRAPVAVAPASAHTFDSKTGITLKVDGLPSDQDSDEVLLRYQVTNTRGTWNCNDQNGQHCSKWTDEDTFDVPAVWLSDGGTYYWRVQSADILTGGRSRDRPPGLDLG